MFGRIPFVKLCAVSAALCCAGGAAIVNNGGTGAGTPAAPSTTDHYLCVGDSGGWCIPARTTLPDGTIFDVGDPTDRLVCAPIRHNDRGRRSHDTTTVAVTNEFSPTGSAGPTPVPLAVGPTRSTCALVPKHHFGQFSHSSASAAAVTFSCSDAAYAPLPAVRFAPPFPVKIGDRLLLRVLDPSRLCVPATTAPTVTPAAVSGTTALVCFDVSFANRSRRFSPDLSLCVPSTIGGNTPPAGSSTTSSTGATSTTATSTTTSTTTTTTQPATSTTTTSTTTASTTTTSTTTSTTSTSTTTTTTTPPGTQPCAGVIINGVCIITV